MSLVHRFGAIVFTLIAVHSLWAQSTALPALNQTLPNQTMSSGGVGATVDLRNYFTVSGITGQVAQFNTVLGKFDAVLLASAAPKNVTNFLNYVNRGAYTNSFIHRSVPGFVIQGGGFGVVNNALTAIPTDPPVQNEFKVSNTRGTLAMAKTSAGPDTATNQWFVNLADNSGNLDNQNGGFTVFASVLGTGMTVADAIAAVTVYDASATIGATFNQLPLLGSALTTANLITIYSIKVVPLFPAAPGDDAVATFSATSGNTGIATVAIAGSALTVTPVAAGSATITVTATDVNGNVATGTFTVNVQPSSPTITTQPQASTIATGSTVVFSVAATGTGLTYQWAKNGVNLPGATTASFLLANAQPTDSGNYNVTVTNSSGSTSSTAAALTVLATTTPGRLVNLSTRGQVGTGGNVLIAGFVITGSASKPVIIRGVGPTLGLPAYGVTGTLPDPLLTLQLTKDGSVVSQNDNWATAGDPATVTAAMAWVGAFALPTGSLDSVISTTLAPGTYTATLSGNGAANTGVAIVEIYDATVTLDNTSPRLVNISTRGVVGTGASVMIPGFVITGATAKTVLIRCVGPTLALAPYNVTGTLADPIIYLNDSHGTVINQNDNWGTVGDAALITSAAQTTGAFALAAGSKDSALIVTLPPGSYTVTVNGVNATTGVALVEVYELP